VLEQRENSLRLSQGLLSGQGLAGRRSGPQAALLVELQRYEPIFPAEHEDLLESFPGNESFPRQKIVLKGLVPIEHGTNGELPELGSDRGNNVRPPMERALGREGPGALEAVRIVSVHQICRDIAAQAALEQIGDAQPSVIDMDQPSYVLETAAGWADDRIFLNGTAYETRRAGRGL
jgi:hypothetical protein